MTFCKTKWYKTKKQLPLISVSLFLSPQLKRLLMSSFMLSVTPLQALLGFSDTLGRILLMAAQNKSRSSQTQFQALVA